MPTTTSRDERLWLLRLQLHGNHIEQTQKKRFQGTVAFHIHHDSNFRLLHDFKIFYNPLQLEFPKAQLSKKTLDAIRENLASFLVQRVLHGGDFAIATPSNV
jgi:hypothetical protein